MLELVSKTLPNTLQTNVKLPNKMLLRHLLRPSAARITAATNSFSVYNHRPIPNFTSGKPNLAFQNPNFTPETPNLTPQQLNFTLRSPNITSQNPNFTSPDPNSPAKNPNFTSQNPNFSSKNPNLIPKAPNFTSKNLFLTPKTPMFTVFAATCTTFSAADKPTTAEGDSKRGEELEERIKKMLDELSEDVGAIEELMEEVEELRDEGNLDALLEVLAEFRDASGVVLEKWRELEKMVESYDGTGEMTRTVRRSMKQLENIRVAANRGILVYGIRVLKTKATALMSGVVRVLSRLGSNSKRI